MLFTDNMSFFSLDWNHVEGVHVVITTERHELVYKLVSNNHNTGPKVKR